MHVKSLSTLWRGNKKKCKSVTSLHHGFPKGIMDPIWCQKKVCLLYFHYTDCKAFVEWNVLIKWLFLYNKIVHIIDEFLQSQYYLNTFKSNTLFDIIWQKRYKIHIFVYSKTCYLYINIKQFYPFQLIFCDQLTANT